MTDKLIPMLDEIKARHEAATKGPWWAETFEVQCEGLLASPCDGGCTVCDGEGYVTTERLRGLVGENEDVIGDVGTRTDAGHGIGPYIQVYDLEEFAGNDAAFIAHSRTDIPRMERRLRAMQRVIEAQKSLYIPSFDSEPTWQDAQRQLEEAESALAELIAKEWT